VRWYVAPALPGGFETAGRVAAPKDTACGDAPNPAFAMPRAGSLSDLPREVDDLWNALVGRRHAAAVEALDAWLAKVEAAHGMDTDEESLAELWGLAKAPPVEPDQDDYEIQSGEREGEFDEVAYEIDLEAYEIDLRAWRETILSPLIAVADDIDAAAPLIRAGDLDGARVILESALFRQPASFVAAAYAAAMAARPDRRAPHTLATEPGAPTP